jgi:POT family proton-dependent oligopeptide transporter
MFGSKNSLLPRGLPYIVSNEAAERFSFYGMKGILVIYMTNFLQARGGGLDVMTSNEANVWYHTFVMGVYFLPLFGALLSDIFLGKYKTIIALSIVYCLGHAVMAADQTRLGLSLGLSLIAIGAGGIKPCVSAHLGDQFDESNQGALDTAYAWFYWSINVGAALSMLLGEPLLREFGPHVAFGLPGVLMLLATWVFWYGRRTYIAMPAAGWDVYRREVFSRQGMRVVFKLLPVFALVAIFWSLYDQTGSSWIQQANSDFVLKKFSILGQSLNVLPSQIQALNSILILIYVPLLSVLIYPFFERLGIRLTYVRKIGAGLFITVLSFLIIAGMEEKVFAAQDVSISGQVWAYFILTFAEALISLTCLEFAYTQAPNSMKSFIMGLYFCSLACGNFITAEVNRWMRDPVSMELVSTGESTIVQLEESMIITGRKFMMSGQDDLQILVPDPEDGGATQWSPMQGTFVMKDLGDGRVELLNSLSWQPVSSKGSWSPDDGTQVYVNKLVGPAYFRFFAYMMLIAAILFIPVAYFFREKRILQDHQEAEAST